MSMVFVMLVSGLAAATSAEANGPCGQDFDGNHACAVNSSASYTGSLVTDNESDYYVLYARAGTELSVSITDTENPQCSSVSEPISCGDARVNLVDANGNSLYESAESRINNAITVTGTFAHTLEAAGTYYLIVSGRLGADEHGNNTAVPYTLGVIASPNVQWPAPPPPPPPPPPPRLSPPTPSVACLRDRLGVARELLVVQQYTRKVHAHHLSRRTKRRYQRVLASARRSLGMYESLRHRQCPNGV